MSGASWGRTVPDIVKAAEARCRELGFTQNSTAETGRLLQALAATVTAGTIAEIGGGCGYGAAWLLSGLQPDARLVTVELNATYAEAARELFAGDARVEVTQGDWTTILDHGPFRLAFVDVAPAKDEGAGLVIDTLAPGGIALLDDFTPIELWPDEWRGQPDTRRERWLLDDRLAAVELRVAADHAVILATRRSV